MHAMHSCFTAASSCGIQHLLPMMHPTQHAFQPTEFTLAPQLFSGCSDFEWVPGVAGLVDPAAELLPLVSGPVPPQLESRAGYRGASAPRQV